MGLWKAINKGLHNINEVGTKTVAPAVGKVINKGLKKAPDIIESGAGILNTGIKKIQSTIGKIKNGEVGRAISEGTSKVARTVLADDSSYKHAINVGNKGVQWSNKPLILDQLNSTTKSYLDRGAAVFDSISKDKVNVPFTKGNKQMKNPWQLIRKDSDSLIGYKATKRGALVAGGLMLASGVPGAGEQFIKNRQGTNFDQQATTSAPRVPAYANNGGATGDLVFALNNLRHGGMM